MYEVWCEWDIGIEGLIFSTREVAIRHIIINCEACGIYESFEELYDAGLIRLNKVEIITE